MPPKIPVRCERTLDLFSVSQNQPPAAGSMNIDTQLRHLISAVLKRIPESREVIAGKMTELLGDDVTIHMLNAWTAESRDGHRFPVAYLPAFEAACGSFEVSEFLAGKRGGKFLVGEATLEAELGRLDREERAIRDRRTALRRMLQRGASRR